MPEQTKKQTEVLQTVYSPLGEKFELSPANARDVLRHAKFTSERPHPDTVAAHLAGDDAETSDNDGENADDTNENDGDNADENSDENTDENDGDNADENSDENTDENDGDNADENSDDNTDENSDEDAPKAKTQPFEFADMDRDAVRAYIEATFPEAQIDGRKNRDGLVAFAIELATAA